MSLPDATRVYCAHEYTLANARFALTVDPDNAELVARAAEIAQLREANQPTIPTHIGLERATNPFLRPDSASMPKPVEDWRRRSRRVGRGLVIAGLPHVEELLEVE